MAHQTDTELEIRNLLLSKYAPGEIVERMSSRLYETQLPMNERRVIFAFAYNSGHFGKIMQHVPELLRLRSMIPWAFLVEILSRSKTRPGKDVLEALVKGARRQDQVQDLILAHGYDRFLPVLNELRNEVYKQREKEKVLQRQRLLDKIAFFRNEQLGDEEKRLIELMRKMYPQDPEVLKIQVEFEERWARHVIAKHGGVDMTITDHFEPTPNPKFQEAMAPAFQEMKARALNHPHLAYDFAVALMMMEFELWALEIIREAPPELALDWLQADALLRSRRFVECLDHLSTLEGRYGGNPETSFAVTYLRAQALWGLKQPSRAQELIQSILSIRPGYRSASSLLKDWLGGAQA